MNQFYSHKFGNISEGFEFPRGFDHPKNADSIKELYWLLKECKIFSNIKSERLIHVQIQWLTIFNNPGGVMDTFDIIQSIIYNILSYTYDEDTRVYSTSRLVEVLGFVFFNLRLMNNEQDMIQGVFNLCHLFNCFKHEKLKKKLEEVIRKIDEKEEMHITHWEKVLKNLLNNGYRKNVALLINILTEKLQEEKRFAELYYLMCNVIENNLVR